MSREQNIATQEQAAEKLNSGDIDGAVDTLFAVDAVDHDPAPGQGPGREGYRTFFQTLATAFPDAQLEPATMVADDDHVVLAYSLSGTHQGDFNGIPPTGEKIDVRGVQIGRFENGQIVERWGATDELGIMQQIGAAPKAPGALGKLADKLSG